IKSENKIQSPNSLEINYYSNPNERNKIVNDSLLDENLTKSQKIKVKLLEEILLIAKNESVDLNHFWFFPLNKKTKLTNGFILVTKAGVNGSPVRKTYVYKRFNSELRLLNLFNGYLIQRNTSSVGDYDDLLIHFGNQKFPVERDGGKFLFDCSFEWNGKNYSFLNCDRINNSKIKPIYIDSINKDTYTFLKSRKYF
ncbi:MAG: hypothetical protein P8I93_02975, partial [Crocinitomicaceae bacterium]|nr:hypothetical protein [Crocinitomicaceae bacterium]